MSESEISQNATETTTAAAAAPAAAPARKIERRVYVDDKRYGHCVSFDAMVFICPTGLTFPPKSTPRLTFTVGEGQLIDEAGGIWLAFGENPGCGPRCPVSLREKYGKVWRGLSHADRLEIIKSLAPVAAAAAATTESEPAAQ